MGKARDAELLKKLGNRFSAIRRAAGKTQEETAEAMLIQSTSLSRWERGHTGLSLPVLQRAADFLGVGLGDLLDVSREFPDMTTKEEYLIRVWRSLTARQQEIALSVMEEMDRRAS